MIIPIRERGVPARIPVSESGNGDDRMSDSRKGRIKEAGKDRRDGIMKRAFML